jgi:ATP-binding cassette subfamily B protein
LAEDDEHSDDEHSDRDAPGLDRRLVRRMGAYLWPYKGWVALAVGLTLSAALLGAVRPWLTKIAIDDYIVEGDLGGLRWIILALVGALVVEGAMAFVNEYLTKWIGQQAIYDLRTEVFAHVQRQRLAFFDNTPVGRLITRTTSDVESINQVLSSGLVVILGDLARLIFITGFMFYVDWVLALVVLGVMPFMVGVMIWFRRNAREQYRRTRKQIARINSFMQEHVTGMSVVQLFGREEEEMRRFEDINADHRHAQIQTIFYFALFWPAIALITDAALGAVLWFGGLRAMAGSALTAGVLIAFIQYARQFFRPIRNLSNQYNTLQRAMAGAERIFDLLDNDRSIAEAGEPAEIENVRGKIEFDGVWFTYDDLPADWEAQGIEPEWILKDVSFTVEPGQTAAFVGATGAGKTTVINLLLRFYEIQRGEIRLDGVPLDKLRLEDLRSHIGLILQDVFLFSGSVERNLTLEDDSVATAEMKRAAEAVRANDFIEQLPDGYAQEVSERGASLSHGQRQLLAFVRALIYDPAVLVLDEATSSVDTETEELIQQAVGRLMEGRTSLAIAHRLSTVEDADLILVLHKGEIRERGTHQQLLAMDGLYRRLYELQYAEEVPLPGGDGAASNASRREDVAEEREAV